MARHLALCALGLTLALAGTAGAAAKPLVTPPLIGQTGTRLQCRVLNAGTKDAVLTMEILDELGNHLAGPFNPTVFPNQTQSLTTAVSPGVGWCRVTGISKGAARITLCVVDANTTCTAAVTVP